MSAYQDYLQGLATLAREDRADPLAEAIQARLYGQTGPVAGLISPPLDRDEPDPAAVLLHLYRELDSPADAAARHRLRRVLVDLVCAAFRHAPLEYIDRLGGLIGFCRVRDDQDLAEGLRNRLWGHLESGLPCELKGLPLMQGEELERASRALDLWVSMLSPMAAMPDHHRERIESLFRDWRLGLGGWTLNPARFQVLTLLFRALLKVSPQVAGKEHLPDLVREVAKLAERDEDYRRRWLGLCWEFGVLLRRRPEWRAELLRGLKRRPPDGNAPALLWTSLEYLDRLDVDLKASTARRPLPTEKRSARLSIVK